MEQILKIFDLTVRDGQMILVGTVVFFIFWRLVDVIIFKPFFQVYEEREALTSGASESSKHLIDQADELSRQYDDQIHAGRVVAMSEKFKALVETKKEAAQITAAAENEAHELIRKARWDRENTLSETKAMIMKEVEPMARVIADRLKQPAAASKQSGIRN